MEKRFGIKDFFLFLLLSGLIVVVRDAKTPLPASLGVADPGQINDYRWIIEEDRTFYVDPKCQINSTDPLLRPSTCPVLRRRTRPVLRGTRVLPGALLRLSARVLRTGGVPRRLLRPALWLWLRLSRRVLRRARRPPALLARQQRVGAPCPPVFLPRRRAPSAARRNRPDSVPPPAVPPAAAACRP